MLGFPFAFRGLVVISALLSLTFAIVARGATRMLWEMCEIVRGVGRRDGDRGIDGDKIAPDCVDSSDQSP